MILLRPDIRPAPWEDFRMGRCSVICWFGKYPVSERKCTMHSRNGNRVSFLRHSILLQRDTNCASVSIWTGMRQLSERTYRSFSSFFEENTMSCCSGPFPIECPFAWSISEHWWKQKIPDRQSTRSVPFDLIWAVQAFNDHLHRWTLAQVFLNSFL